MTARYPLVLNGTTIEEVQSADTLIGLTSGNAILAGNGSGGIKNVSLSGDISFDGNTLTVSAAAFPAGTAMLFAQTAAPTGWTKSTTHNDKALRVVSGTASSGGTYTFSSTFANGSAGATTLSSSQIPAHSHKLYGSSSTNTESRGLSNSSSWCVAGDPNGDPALTRSYISTSPQTGQKYVQDTGDGGSHTHSLSLAVQYVDVIIATKD